jgi:hypothetical protein
MKTGLLIDKRKLNQNSELSVYKKEISVRVGNYSKKEISLNALHRRSAFQKQS